MLTLTIFLGVFSYINVVLNNIKTKSNNKNESKSER